MEEKGHSMKVSIPYTLEAEGSSKQDQSVRNKSAFNQI